ncbi:MAG: GFA family protein [Hylemonella sp.]|nr:GFA family protein [Hylemonella sp.]MDH5709008.1 GFA family protein [Hylemonella sp.]
MSIEGDRIMFEGSCLCGAVRYALSAEPGPIIKCHCRKCRKASGTAFATNALVERKDFTLQAGQEALAEYESTPGVFRVFCRHCASPLYSRRPHEPERIRLRIGTLDTPIAARPTAHIFVESKAEWDEICDDLPQYAQRP